MSKARGRVLKSPRFIVLSSLFDIPRFMFFDGQMPVNGHLHSGPPQRRRATCLLMLLLLAGCVLTLPGCGGCRQDQQAAKKEEDSKKKEKKKEEKPYDFSRLEMVPSDDSLMRNFVKSGHAVTASMSGVANMADLRAEVESDVTDLEGAPIPMGDTRYHLVMSRPAVLPKGQRKSLEFTFFIPHEVGETSTLFLRYRLLTARGGSVVYPGSDPTRQMPAHQYLFVVLSTNPNAYGYLKQIESVRPMFNELLDEGTELLYYRVVLPTVEDRVPLPSHPFAWTMIAYVLWDGTFTDRMTPDQQQAMLDWLHWGGQLIISGPGSLDHLAGSFLAPYLPATSDGAVELTADAVQPLNEYWSLARSKLNTRLTLDVVASSPLVGVQLRPHAEAVPLTGTGQLVAERRVGRGRIVVTSFGLSAPDVVNWGSYDSFFNNGLLRRPRRAFTANRFGSPQTNWADIASRQRDPLFVTATRYFARDVGQAFALSSGDIGGAEADWHLDGCESNRLGGIASWSDTSGAAASAHRTLQEAAGISIPKAAFVLRVLMIYLLILVPVNWGVFRLWGRVEWAWGAAPLIAIVGAVAVIRLAQLDIGFVRSRTEIAVLELHAGHPDAHLTRYTALYSSLSTSYALQFDDPSAIARPFPPTPSPDRLWPVTIRREEGIRLSGFQVDSNTTGFIHSEQMCDVGGTLQVVGDSSEQWSVENGTTLGLRDVQLFHRAPAGVMTCRLKELPAGTAARVEFTRLAERPNMEPTESAVQSVTRPRGGDISLQGMMNLAAWGTALRPGDARLVAWTEDTLPGLTIEPSASQARIRTVVLVNLRYGPLPPPLPDANLRVDVQETREEPDDTEVRPTFSFPNAPDNQEPQ